MNMYTCMFMWSVCSYICLCFLERGVCTQAPCYCIIMEYCAHGQLYEVLRAGRKITPRLLVDWSTGIASGMNYLHLHKIIHRDLKSPKWVLELTFQSFSFIVLKYGILSIIMKLLDYFQFNLNKQSGYLYLRILESVINLLTYLYGRYVQAPVWFSLFVALQLYNYETNYIINQRIHFPSSQIMNARLSHWKTCFPSVFPPENQFSKTEFQKYIQQNKNRLKNKPEAKRKWKH